MQKLITKIISPHGRSISYSLIDHFILAQERPVIFWSERDKEVVTENDLVNNFDILKEYLWCVGGATPLPHMLHHEVGGGLHWFPIHLHVVDGLSTDDALCRISCPWLQNQYIWLLRQCSDASVQLRKLVLQFGHSGHLCSEHDPTLDFGNMLSCPSAPWAWASARTSTWGSIPWPLFVSRPPSSCSVWRTTSTLGSTMSVVEEVSSRTLVLASSGSARSWCLPRTIWSYNSLNVIHEVILQKLSWIHWSLKETVLNKIRWHYSSIQDQS